MCQYNKLKHQQSSARRTSSLRTGPAKILQCESCGGFDLLNVTLGVQTVWGSMDWFRYRRIPQNTADSKISWVPLDVPLNNSRIPKKFMRRLGREEIHGWEPQSHPPWILEESGCRLHNWTSGAANGCQASWYIPIGMLVLNPINRFLWQPEILNSDSIDPCVPLKMLRSNTKPWLLGECFREKMIKGYGRRNRFVNRLLSIALSENSLP